MPHHSQFSKDPTERCFYAGMWRLKRNLTRLLNRVGDVTISRELGCLVWWVKTKTGRILAIAPDGTDVTKLTARDRMIYIERMSKERRAKKKRPVSKRNLKARVEHGKEK